MEEIRPLADRVVVKKIKDVEEETSSGLILLNKADSFSKAEVVAIGPGNVINGHRVPMQVAVGNIVLYNDSYGTDVGSFATSHSNEYMLLHEEDITAIVE